MSGRDWQRITDSTNRSCKTNKMTCNQKLAGETGNAILDSTNGSYKKSKMTCSQKVSGKDWLRTQSTRTHGGGKTRCKILVNRFLYALLSCTCYRLSPFYLALEELDFKRKPVFYVCCKRGGKNRYKAVSPLWQRNKAPNIISKCATIDEEITRGNN